MTTLDKIKAEIQQIEPYILPCGKRTPERIRDMALDIIDKYAEQEPTEDYEYEIDRLQNRLDIAEYDKERLKEEIKALEQEPCDDAISREAVKELIKSGISTDTYEDIELVCKWVDEMPPVRQQEPKWIPVSERLPEEREWYLAVFKEIDTGYQLIPRVADYIGAGKNEWRLIDEDGLAKEYRDILECIAWMPLPKPFEPQESEDKK